MILFLFDNGRGRKKGEGGRVKGEDVGNGGFRPVSQEGTLTRAGAIYLQELRGGGVVVCGGISVLHI